MKRILCLFLCLMMLIPASISLADDTVVRNVTLIIAQPVIGATAGENAPNIELFDNTSTGKYIFKDNPKWTESDYQTALPSSTKFEGGKTYYLTFQLKIVKTIWTFDDSVKFTLYKERKSSYSIPSDLADKYTEVTGYTVEKENGENKYLSVKMKITIQTLDKVNLTINPPMAGSRVSWVRAADCVTLPSDAKYSFVSASWEKKENDTFVGYADNERLIKDNTYIYMVVYPDNNYDFPQKGLPDISISGGEMISATKEENYRPIEICIKVNITGENLVLTTINNVSLSFDPPTAKATVGTSQPTVSIPSGSPYSVVPNSWKWTTSDYQTPLNSDTAFQYPCGDYATVTLQAADGYEFADHIPTADLSCEYLVNSQYLYSYVNDCVSVLDDSGRYYDKLLLQMLIYPNPYATINQVSLTVTPPAAGTTASVPLVATVPSGSHYYVDSDSIEWGNSDLSDRLDESTVFEAGKTYYAYVCLYTEDDYAFDNNPTISVSNGQHVQSEGFGLGNYNDYLDFIVEVVIPGLYTVNVTNDGNGTASASPASGVTGTEVTLASTPNEGYQFKEWQVVSGGVTVNGNKFTIGTADVEIKAIFEKIPDPVYTVTVSNDGNGTGTANPASGVTGTAVTLTSTPNEGFQFKEWQVISGNVTVTNNTFTIGTANVEVKAIFDKIPDPVYTVTVTNDGNGTGTANPASGVTGTAVTLTATANEEYQFKEWQVISGGVTVTNNTFTIGTANVEVKAIFDKIPDSVYTVTVTNDGNGTGTANPASGVTGTAVTLTATANEGYQFKEWQVISGGVSVADNRFVIGTANVEIKAVFDKIPETTPETPETTETVPDPVYTVTVTNDGNGTGAANPASGVTGTVVTLTATANDGYQFKEWQVISGGVTVTDNVFTIGTANVEIKAVFDKIPDPVYTVTVTNDGNGTGVANPASGVTGTAVTLTATPNDGFRFKEWQVISGSVTITDNVFTIGTANVEVKAVFEVALVQPGAYSDPEAGNFDIATDGTATFTSPTSNQATVTIPDTVIVNGVPAPVTRIANNAFKKNKKLTNVSIGNNVKVIGANAFSNCKKLKSVSGAANVEEIEKGAFAANKKIKSMPNMPNLRKIGDEAFKGCTSLTKAVIGESVNYIGKNAFADCSKLKTIKILSTQLTKGNVKKGAFKGINAKAKITCPKSVLEQYKKFLYKKGVPGTAKIK